MELKPRMTKGAGVEQTPAGWRLSIPAGGSGQYRLAQMDDCSHLPRREFPHRSIDLRLRARLSSNSLSGTWGFGAWNDPYRLRPIRGEYPLHLLVLPNAAWFFHSSEESYLSFCDDKPANGFLAQTFCSRGRSLLPLLEAAGLFLVSRSSARRKLRRLIEENAALLTVDASQWHSYRMIWRSDRVSFEVDGAAVLETSTSPRLPLGAIIWIDNQFAAFTPEGRIASGSLANPAAWLEIEDLELRT